MTCETCVCALEKNGIKRARKIGGVADWSSRKWRQPAEKERKLWTTERGTAREDSMEEEKQSWSHVLSKGKWTKNVTLKPEGCTVCFKNCFSLASTLQCSRSGCYWRWCAGACSDPPVPRSFPLFVQRWWAAALWGLHCPVKGKQQDSTVVWGRKWRGRGAPYVRCEFEQWQ